jgi:hypothetical protein
VWVLQPQEVGAELLGVVRKAVPKVGLELVIVSWRRREARSRKRIENEEHERSQHNACVHTPAERGRKRSVSGRIGLLRATQGMHACVASPTHWCAPARTRFFSSVRRPRRRRRRRRTAADKGGSCADKGLKEAISQAWHKEQEYPAG